MPIIDVELVCETEGEFANISARDLADSLGQTLKNPPGRTWVRLRFLSSSGYAENGVILGSEDLPTFVTVLHAHPPTGEALTAELGALTATVARCLSRPAERVHVQYAPPGAQRQAFGGVLVR
jgi:hypothetical protein